MKKKLNYLSVLFLACLLSSCATVFGGKVTSAQRTKPKEGEPARKVRPVAVIADALLFWPGLIVDFATGAIYKPAPKSESEPKVEAASVKK